MKEYNEILLEDEEVQALLDITQLAGGPVKSLLFSGDIDAAIKSSNLEEETFWYDAHHIVGLYFSSSKIKKLPESIGNLSHLRYLIVNSSSIQEIPFSLKNLTNLEIIKFIRDAQVMAEIILEFPDIFQNLTNLKTFYVKGNFAIYFPSSFFELKNLEVLNLELCFFFTNYTSFKLFKKPRKRSANELPSSLDKLISLKILVLKSIYRLELPSSIMNLSLKKIDLSYSQGIRNVDVIFNIKTLKELNLERFKISSLPKSIGNLKRLKILNVAGNALKDIPLEITNCRHLEVLDLSRNYFSKELKFLSSLNNLRTIIYDHYHPEIIPEELFKKTELELKAI